MVQTAAQSGGTSDVTATATVTIDKAQPRLSFSYVSRAQLRQPECYATYPVFMPLLNQGELSYLEGATRWLDTRLDSASPGNVVYYVDNQFLPFNGATGTLQGARGGHAVAGTAGIVRDLVIRQDETANFHGETIVVPGAVFIWSTVNITSCAV